MLITHKIILAIFVYLSVNFFIGHFLYKIAHREIRVSKKIFHIFFFCNNRCSNKTPVIRWGKRKYTFVMFFVGLPRVLASLFLLSFLYMATFMAIDYIKMYAPNIFSQTK
jgi:hypothetical protein